METYVTGDAITGEGSGPETADATRMQNRSGLKTINRLQSAERIAKIVPTSDNEVILHYYSRFARDFVTRDYNFCAAKMAVARNGKTLGIDLGFKMAEDWYCRAMPWANNLDTAPFPLFAETISLPVPHPSAGRLIRILGEFDKFFVTMAGAALAGSVTAESHAIAMSNAEARVNYIHHLCRFDSDQFDDADGSLLKRK